jgi:hypothetical protein
MIKIDIPQPKLSSLKENITEENNKHLLLHEIQRLLESIV